MSMSLGSGNVTASVTGSVSTNAAVLPTGATQVVATGDASNASTDTLHTVTAGKTLYITAVTLVASGGSGTQSSAKLSVEFSSGVWTDICRTRALVNGTTTTQTIALNPPMELGAGLSIRCEEEVASASSHAYATITGWEE